MEIAGRCLDRVVDRGGLAVDQRVGIQTLRRMVPEPGVAEAAGILRLDDPIAVGVELDVVAHAAAERAGGVFHHGQAHCIPFGVKLLLLVARLVSARTGRNDERSPKLPAGKAAARAARHVPARLDHFPRANARGAPL